MHQDIQARDINNSNLVGQQNIYYGSSSEERKHEEEEKLKKEIEKKLELQNKLVTACEIGDLKEVKILLKKGADPIKPDGKGKEPLGAAIWGMNGEIVNFLSTKQEKEELRWEKWVKHNLKKYKKVFMIRGFWIETYGEWREFLIGIENNSYLKEIYMNFVKNTTAKIGGVYGYWDPGEWKELRDYVFKKEHSADLDYENPSYTQYSRSYRWNIKVAMHDRIKAIQRNIIFIIEQSWEEKEKRYRKLAEEGDAKAQNELGLYYCYGYGGFARTKDDIEAAEWYHKAAKQGNAEAQYNLGYCYHYGYGVTKNENNAVYWYYKAATNGHLSTIELLKDLLSSSKQESILVSISEILGYCYYNGYGVTRDEKEAVIWYSRALVPACEQGDEKRVSNCLMQGAKPNVPNAAGKHPLGAAVWGMNPTVVNHLLSRMGDTKPMTWKECEEHNKKHYGAIFIVDRFEPKDILAWKSLLEKIDASPFLVDMHIKLVRGTWKHEVTSSKESLQEWIQTRCQNFPLNNAIEWSEGGQGAVEKGIENVMAGYIRLQTQIRITINDNKEEKLVTSTASQSSTSTSTTGIKISENPHSLLVSLPSQSGTVSSPLNSSLSSSSSSSSSTMGYQKR
ncbi:MAG: SEL1-like repeat protein [Proteobacteria bacterium]|nr:SEL1-like repeat protein [Pseudomonadota bacterium]